MRPSVLVPLFLLGCSSVIDASTARPTATRHALDVRAFSVTEADDGAFTLARRDASFVLHPELPAPSRSVWGAGSIVRTRAGIEEVLTEDPRGAVELSYRFESADRVTPIRLGLQGAHVVRRGRDGVWLRAGEALFRIGQGTWVDANGLRTEIPAAGDGDTIAYTVAPELLARTAFPAVLDPTIDMPVELEGLAGAPTFEDKGGGMVAATDSGFLVAITRFAAEANTFFVRFTQAGAPIDAAPRPLFSGFTPTSVASSGSTVLFVGFGPGGTAVARRVSPDGVLLDAAPIVLAKDIASVGSAAWDGSRFVVAYASSAKKFLAHVGTDGVVAEPSGVEVDLWQPIIACTAKTCIGESLPGLQLFSETFAPTASIISNAGILAASGTDFLFREVFGTTRLRISTTGTTSSSPTTSNAGLAAAGSASGYLVIEHDGATTPNVRAVRLPATGTTPLWTASLGTMVVGGGYDSRILAMGATTALFVPSVAGTRARAFAIPLASAPTTPPVGIPYTSHAPTQEQSAVASDGKNFLFAWLEDRDGALTIRSRLFDGALSPVQASSLVVATVEDAPSDLSLAFDGTRYHLAWVGPSGVQHVRIGSDGALVDSSPAKIADAGRATRPLTIAGAGGRALGAWVDTGWLQLVRFDATGAVEGAVTRVEKTESNTLGFRHFPRVALSSSGTSSLVAWASPSGASTDLRAAIVKADGALPTAGFPLLSRGGTQRNPSAAWSGSVHLVAFTDVDGASSATIRALRVDATGKVLDADPSIVVEGVDAWGTPRVDWDGGAFVVTALRPTPAGGEVRELVFARVREDGAVVTEGGPVSTVTKESTTPRFTTQAPAASDGHGTTVVVSATMLAESPYGSQRALAHAIHAKRPLGATCAAGSECEAGLCVDGVCCASACEGTCEACDLPGSLGTCSLVHGAPHGKKSCVTGAASDPCNAGSCDGTTATKCAAFAIAAGGACTAPSCEGNVYVAPGVCSEARVCTVPASVSCAPFRCTESGCSKTCSKDEECAGKARCIEGSCVPSPSGARCSSDGLSSIGADDVAKSCAPFRCDTDGACATRCTASSECVPGFVCDLGTGACAEAPVAESDGGGCTISSASRTSTSGLALVGALIAAGFLRRRRAIALSSTAGIALGLAGCDPQRAQERTEVATTSSALTVGPEGSSADATKIVGPPASSTIACSAGGCLTVQARGAWYVGVRLDSSGAPLDPFGFVIAPSPYASASGSRPEMAVGTDGKDYLVVFPSVASYASAGGFSYVLVGGDGKVSKPRDLVPISIGATRARVAWDGTNWVVVWHDARRGSDSIEVTRIAPDGSKVDVDGSLVGFGDEGALRCGVGECFVGVSATTTAGTGQLFRFASGVIGSPVDAGMAPTGMLVEPTSVLVVGTASDGIRARRFGKDLVAMGASKTILSSGTEASVEQTSAGTLVMATTFSAGSLARLDTSLNVLASATSLAPSELTATGSIGTKAFATTQEGVYTLATSPLGATPLALEGSAIPHSLRAAANDGTTTMTAFTRRVAGKDTVLVAAAASGAITPAAGTVVAAEDSKVESVSVAWIGDSYVVAWVSQSRLAIARIGKAGEVLDPGGKKIGEGAYYNGCVTVAASKDVAAVVAIDEFGKQVRVTRVSTTGTVLDSTPKVSKAEGGWSADLRREALVTSAGAPDGHVLVAFSGSGMPALLLGPDGTVQASAKLEAAAVAVESPSIVSDGSQWMLAFADARTSASGTEASDIRMMRVPFTLTPASPSWVLSNRDAEQLSPALSIDGARASVSWLEHADDGDELRVSWIELASKSVLVDAAKIASAGAREIGAVFAGPASGPKGSVVYGRADADPAIFAPRVKTRAYSFDALAGTTCTKNEDCELGFCVDGVCCDRACTGVCESCNEPSTSGKCTTVAGKPRGARMCTGTGCAEAQCDGVEATTCSAFAHGFETKCAEPTCAGALFTAGGYCDGKGTCATPMTASCAPYACDPIGCLTSCSSDASCAKGFACKDGRCVTPELVATCVQDGIASQASDGTIKDCAPYRCGAEGTCLQQCASSVDCGPGAVCDTAAGTCSTPVATDEGGCSTSSRPASLGWWFSLLLLAPFARRRGRISAG
jgi:hypothetical protein